LAYFSGVSNTYVFTDGWTHVGMLGWTLVGDDLVQWTGSDAEPPFAEAASVRQGALVPPAGLWPFAGLIVSYRRVWEKQHEISYSDRYDNALGSITIAGALGSGLQDTCRDGSAYRVEDLTYGSDHLIVRIEIFEGLHVHGSAASAFHLTVYDNRYRQMPVWKIGWDDTDHAMQQAIVLNGHFADAVEAGSGPETRAGAEHLALIAEQLVPYQRAATQS
jgi:hypothetical protein